MFSSQRSELFSQDDYLTPATQDNPSFLTTFAVASPSPIKKRSRRSPGSRERILSNAVISEEGEEDVEEETVNGVGGSAGSDQTSEHAGGSGRENVGTEFRNLSQGIVDRMESLQVIASSPEEEGGIGSQDAGMECSQDAAMGFRLNSVGADWSTYDREHDPSIARATSHYRFSAPAKRTDAMQGDEMVQIVVIPPSNTNPFALARTRQGQRLASGDQALAAPIEGRKRHRQRNIRIPYREGRRGAPPISRYLMEYEQLETIGAGRFSMVYKCRRRFDGWIYAVKRTKHTLDSEPERETARREVYALAALQHCPQIIRYMSGWMEDNYLYIVTEFSYAGSLERAIFPCGRPAAESPVDNHDKTEGLSTDQTSNTFSGEESELLRIARDIASALQYMHDYSIVHMDVKPANILIMSDGLYKLADLGHVIRAGNNMVVTEGDERYLSMEVLKGLDLFKLSAGSEIPSYECILAPNDIFGLGASLYEVASRRPLAPSGPAFQALRQGSIADIPGFSKAFHELLRSMLYPDAQLRPTAEQVVRQAEMMLSTL